MIIVPTDDLTVIHLTPHYVEEEQALDYVLSEGDPATGEAGSLTFGMVAVDFSLYTGQLLYAWGHCPRSGWGTFALPEPDRSCTTALVVGEYAAVTSGEGFEAVGVEERARYDASSGYLLIGEDLPSSRFEFASGTRLVLKGGQPVGLLVHIGRL